MSWLKKRGNVWYRYENIKVANPSYNPAFPPSKDNPKHVWKQTAKAVSKFLETAKVYKNKEDYQKDRTALGLPADRLTWSDFRHKIEKDFFPTVRPRTVLAYRSALNTFEKIAQPDLVDEITPDMVNGFRARRAEGKTSKGKPVSPATINQELTALKSTFQFMRRVEMLDKNPFELVKKFRVGDSVRRAFTRSETAQILESARETGEECHDVIMTYLLTGMRLEELTHLLWDGVNLSNGTYRVCEWQSRSLGAWPKGWPQVHFVPKSKKGRTNPLHPDLIGILKRRHKAKKTPLVFPGMNGPKNSPAIRAMVNRLLTRAGLRGSPHLFRHTYATRNAETGIDPMTLAKLLGHSDVKTTMGYYTGEMDFRRLSQDKMRLI